MLPNDRFTAGRGAAGNGAGAAGWVTSDREPNPKGVAEVVLEMAWTAGTAGEPLFTAKLKERPANGPPGGVGFVEAARGLDDVAVGWPNEKPANTEAAGVAVDAVGCCQSVRSQQMGLKRTVGAIALAPPPPERLGKPRILSWYQPTLREQAQSDLLSSFDRWKRYCPLTLCTSAKAKIRYVRRIDSPQ